MADDARPPYLSWMNDPVIMRFMETRFTSHTAEDLARFITDCNDDPAILLLGLYRRADGTHIGNIKLGPIHHHHRRGDIGIVIGDRTAWGQGYAREAIRSLADHALGPRGLHKVTAGCYAANMGSARAFLAAGFTHEATRTAQLWCESRWQDELLFGRIAADA